MLSALTKITIGVVLGAILVKENKEASNLYNKLRDKLLTKLADLASDR